MVRGIHQ